MEHIKRKLDEVYKEMAPKVDESASLEFEIEQLEREAAAKRKKLKALDKEIMGLQKKIDGYELMIQLGLEK